MHLVDTRDAATLLPIIEAHVRNGSVIHTDGWAAYNNISNLYMVNGVVNHCLYFVDQSSGVHTQFIESYWSKQKGRQKKMKGIDGNVIEDYLSSLCGGIMFVKNNFKKLLI